MSDAYQLWREKLELLLAEEAKAVDPAQKFKIAKDIEEARAKLAELESAPRGKAFEAGAPGPPVEPPSRGRETRPKTLAPKQLVAILAGLIAVGATAIAMLQSIRKPAVVEALKASTVKITVEHSEGTSTGSGIILCQQDGRLDILTAKHVLTGQGLVDDSGERSQRFRGVESYQVAFFRNSPLPIRAPAGAAIVQKAEYKDLALLTLAGVDAPVAMVRIGESAALRSGVEVESVGHLDVDWDWTRGEVRSVGEFIRHSSDIDRGHSGGPVFNAAGEVVGLNLQKYRGVARAIPIEEAMLTVRRWIDPRCAGGVAAVPPPPSPTKSAVGEPIAGQRDVERVAGVDFAWRHIPAGSFQMGSPAGEEGREDDEPRHRVTLTRGFWMGETEVTQAQWQALMGTDPSGYHACGLECPVETVNWYEAVAFANELSKRTGLAACYELSGDNGKRAGKDLVYRNVSFKGLDCPGYRLPSEAEWEYAARAKTTTPFWIGRSLTTRQANYDGNYPHAGQAKGEYRTKPVAVRSFDANAWGLYEVHGNVWEWTQDMAELKEGRVVTDTYQDDVSNPLSTRGPRRVIRGGGWYLGAYSCRAANRDAMPPGSRRTRGGFRLVRTSP